MMKLSNAVGRYLFQRSKAVIIIRGDMTSFSTYLMYLIILMQVQSRKKARGCLNLSFTWLTSVGTLWGVV